MQLEPHRKKPGHQVKGHSAFPMNIKAAQYIQGHETPEGLYLAEPHDPDARPFVSTLEGPRRLNPGDFVAVGPRGDFYAIPEPVFLALYEPVQIPLSLA